MKNYVKLPIVLSFFGLWISTFFSEESQVYIGFGLIFTFGILHGSNDLLIINKLDKKNSKINYFRPLFLYVLFISIILALNFLVPKSIFLLFILVSGFHFGEQHLQHLNLNSTKVIRYLFYMIYGLVVISMLLFLKKQIVHPIIIDLIHVFFQLSLFLYLFIFSATCFILMSIYFIITSKLKVQLLFTELFYLVILAVIFNHSSLIWGFTIYFVIWHSVPSMIHQIQYLYGSFTMFNFIMYCKSALIYWLIALIGLFVFYYLFKDLKMFNTLFFSFLSVVTFPHVFVIINMFNSIKKPS
ncbi:Brp/Blh family beta-carotene 15,15'-dioxygenase [Flavobacterium nakdongensis]|uniref:Brp/Blh family beta-carotene 15,15'-dioxygenase n=1 Tax=Flavobacterium nakdongensis TaxID=3073563 RepID=UPI0038CD4C79